MHTVWYGLEPNLPTIETLTNLKLLPYPRLILDKGIAGHEPNDISAVTLWLWAPVSCEITLDNTPDRELRD